jgi:hypothetical protein
MVGLVGRFAGWRVLYREVFIRACQFRDRVVVEDIRSKGFLTQIKIERFKVNKKVQRFKGSKLPYGSYIERFKVNKKVQR